MRKVEYKQFDRYISDLLTQLKLKEINVIDDNISEFYVKLANYIENQYNKFYETLLLKRREQQNENTNRVKIRNS